MFRVCFFSCFDPYFLVHVKISSVQFCSFFHYVCLPLSNYLFVFDWLLYCRFVSLVLVIRTNNWLFFIFVLRLSTLSFPFPPPRFIRCAQIYSVCVLSRLSLSSSLFLSLPLHFAASLPSLSHPPPHFCLMNSDANTNISCWCEATLEKKSLLKQQNATLTFESPLLNIRGV